MGLQRQDINIIDTHLFTSDNTEWNLQSKGLAIWLHHYEL